MSTNATMLAVDDEVGWIEVCEASFDAADVAVVGVGTVAGGVERLRREPFDIALFDLRLPDGDGLELLKVAREVDADLPVVIMTAFPTVETAIEAVHQGAYDYLVKPFLPEQLQVVVHRALERRRLQRENRMLARRVDGRGTTELTGDGPAMSAVIRQIEQVAPTDSEVLITGPSGTGKELVARAIHRLSGRSGKHFVPVNCAALPTALVESELFGHEKGAFTGASQKQIGLFDFAEGGTILFDEIGELSLDNQAKLLRVIQEREFRRVGGRKQVRSDVRIIAATNRDLLDEVKARNFREDLYYRVAVFEIRVPPLSERRQDIPALVSDLLAELAGELRRPQPELAPGVVDHLVGLEWPGNVRQLKNSLKRAIILAGSGPIGIDELTVGGPGPNAHFVKSGGLAPGDYYEQRDRAVEDFDIAYLSALLARHGGSVALAVEESGLSRSSLYSLLLRRGVQPSSFRPGEG